VGETAGSIIAAISTTQTPTNQPSAPRSTPGLAPIPAMARTVDHHASAESATKNATRPSRAPCRREGLQLRRAHAAQANSERENADFPSYEMPKASIRERVACATVRSGAAG
jgi:hypothetical protein